MKRKILHRLFYDHPPQVVWKYLTDAVLLEQWLMKNDFNPIVGHHFQFRIKPMPDYGFDGIIYCIVTELVPFKKLTYTWQCGPGEGKISLDSVVKWELAPKGEGTELVLEQSGFGEKETLALYDIMDAGWIKNMNKIAALIKNEDHAPTKP